MVQEERRGPERLSVSFSRLSKLKSDSTLFTAGGLGFPTGELSGAWQTAWIRGVLIALFGDAPEPDPDKTTFHYELEAIVDGTREARIVIADEKSNIGGAFGRFGTDVPDPALFTRITEALLERCELTQPADYESKFYEYATQGYGCSKGVAWVGTKKKGAWTCQPRAGTPFFEHAAMRHVFVLDVPGLAQPVLETVTDAELEAYYARHATPGMPRLADLRDHIARAILAERTPPSRIESRAIARAVFDLADQALHDFIPLAGAFTSPYPPVPLDAARTLRKFRKLRALAAADAQADLDACIALLERAGAANLPIQIRRRVL